MKGIKKLLTGILAATMIMGMSVTAFAGDNTITIERSTGTYGQGKEVENGGSIKNAGIQDYTAYKILSVDITEGDPKTYLYYVTDVDQKNALTGTDFFNASEGTDGKWYISLKEEKVAGMSEADKELAVANALNDIKGNFTPQTVQTNDANSAVFEKMDDGYYLIVSSLGSKLVVETVGESVTIKEKNEYPTIDKKQKDDDRTSYTDGSVNVKVGDVISYQITVSIPAKTNQSIIVTDTMSDGLDFDSNITVTGYGAKTVSKPEGKTFTIELPLNSGNATTTTITFDAKVNSSALTETGKKNDVTLDYGNYHQVDSVPYEIYKTGVLKIDGATNKALKGAEFTLSSKKGEELTTLKFKLVEGVYVVDESGEEKLTSDDNGKIIIKGVDSDKTLVLTETKAPANYNMLTDPVTIEAEYIVDIDSPDSEMELFQVENNIGTLLPSTGGIGTTIFYIVGGLLIVAGVAYFIVRRKADAE